MSSLVVGQQLFPADVYRIPFPLNCPPISDSILVLSMKFNTLILSNADEKREAPCLLTIFSLNS
jgi:hypothetical protein